MIREEFNALEQASEILTQLKKGALFSVKDGEKYNTMTIGWGTLGIEWGLPVFVAYIRESRYTHELLEKTNTFTVNLPLVGENVGKILGYCGSKSGRDCDKFSDCNLTAVPGKDVDAPAILQLPVTLECEIIYRQDQDCRKLPESIQNQYYPNGDPHTEYYGKIVNAYILKEK